MRTREDIIRIAGKLQQMTIDRGCTPAEAENAACKLQELLDQYDLSLFDIDKPTEYRENCQDIIDPAPFLRMPVRYTSLASYIGKGFFCKVLIGEQIIQNKRVGVIHWLGFQTDAQMARVTFRYMWANLSQAADEAYDKSDPYTRGDRAPFATGFIISAARQIDKRLTEQRHASEGKVPGSVPGTYKFLPGLDRSHAATALVVMHEMKRDAVAKYVQQQYPHSTQRRRSQASMGTSEAWARGQEYGKRVPLNQNQLPRE